MVFGGSAGTNEAAGRRRAQLELACRAADAPTDNGLQASRNAFRSAEKIEPKRRVTARHAPLSPARLHCSCIGEALAGCICRSVPPKQHTASSEAASIRLTWLLPLLLSRRRVRNRIPCSRRPHVESQDNAVAQPRFVLAPRSYLSTHGASLSTISFGNNSDHSRSCRAPFHHEVKRRRFVGRCLGSAFVGSSDSG